MRAALNCSIWLVGLCLPWHVLMAQEAMLRDPMRPALPVGPARVQSSVGAGLAAADLSDNGDDAPVDVGPELPDRVQMLIVGQGTSSAVIDGSVVSPGDTFRQWRVVQISDEGVLMRYGTQLHRIPLTPQVRKNVPTVAPSK